MTINNSQFIAKNGLDNGGNTIINVTEPINNNDVATKHYVDTNVTWQNISKDPIVYISKGIFNGLLVMTGTQSTGYKIYTSHASSTGNNFYMTGRGADGDDPFFGVNNNLKQIYIPSDGKITKVSCTSYDVHVLMDNGELWTWGYNRAGCSGLGGTAVQVYPILTNTGVSDIYPVLCASADNPGGESRMFLKKNNLLYVTGGNANGQCGVNSTANQGPWTLVNGGAFTNGAIAGWNIYNVYNLCMLTGNTFVEMVNTAGTQYKIYACGSNQNGSLGDGTTTQRNAFVDVTSNWTGAATQPQYIIKKAMYGVFDNNGAGGATYGGTTCLWLNIGANTTIKTCGYNGQGNLGNGNTTNSSNPITVTITGQTGAITSVAMMGGQYKTFYAIDSANKLFGWGYNGYGQLGNGNTTNQSTPIAITTNVSEILSNETGWGGYHSSLCQLIIRKTDNLLYACGYEDAMGYTGTGNTSSFSTLTQIRLPKTVIGTVLGTFSPTNNTRVWVLGTDKGYIYTWGYNGTYGVTDESTYSVMTPVQVNLPPYGD